jgi:hypothetical protein
MDIFDDDSARHVTRTSVLHGEEWFFWIAILSVINPQHADSSWNYAVDRRNPERNQVGPDGGLVGN